MMDVVNKKHRLLVIFMWILSVSVLHAIGCSKNGDDLPEVNDFSDVEPQQLTERIIKGKLAPEDSILLSERYGMLYPRSEFEIDSEMLYILDESHLYNIFVIDKETVELIDTFSITEGRGPGEVSSIQDIKFYQDVIALNDRNLSKVQIWNKDGGLVNEFITEGYHPYRISFWEDSSLVFLSHESMQSGSIFYTVDQEGNHVNSFGNVLGESFNPIRFGGSILTEGEFLYYTGYSEHILGKWNKEGELQYMAATIDDFPGEMNLTTPEGGNTEGGIFGFIPGGFFSAVSATIYQDYLILVHLGYWDEDYEQFLDVYNKHTGQYMISVQLSYRVGHIKIDEEYIYALPRIDDERYLFIYENTLDELLEDEPSAE